MKEASLQTNDKFSFYRGPISNKYPAREMTVKELYQLIKGNKYKSCIEALRQEKDPNKQATMKKQLDYVTPSGIFTQRDSTQMISRSPYICIDLDGKDNPDQSPKKMRLALLNDPLLHPVLTYISPRGNGVKFFVKCNTEDQSVADCVHAVMQYLKDVCRLTADKSCSDPARASFVSWDAGAFYLESEPACGVDVATWLARYEADKHTPASPDKKQLNKAVQTNIVYDDPDGGLERARTISERITTDITGGDYDAFFRLCMSLATLGDAGRDLFKHCCSFYGGKQTVDLDEYFSKCMHDRRGNVTLGTFFEMAREAGTDITLPRKEPVQLSIQDEPDEIDALPMFADSLYERLPPLLQCITDIGATPGERGMLLMSGLSTLSAAMPNYHMIYGGDTIEPNLFFFCLARSGTGKGKMKHCLRLVRPIHDKLVDESVEAIREYKRKEEMLKAANKAKGRNGETVTMNEPMPPYKIFIITAESSSAAFMRTFYENGGRGIMFETEGDTLANIFNKEYGAFSDKLRKIPQHESLGYNRVGDSNSTMNEKGEGTYLEIEHPCMSVILSGTPEQLRNLIPTPENGLFNRFLFYYMPNTVEWINQYGVNKGNPYKKIFDEYARQVYVMYTAFACRGSQGVEFSLTDTQQQRVADYFKNMLVQNHTLYDGDYDGTVRRLGLSHGRICMVLTALRVDSVTDFEHPLQCTDEDVELALELISTLNLHSSFAFRYLTPKPREGHMKNMPPKYQLYHALPNEFSFNDAYELGNVLKISRTSVFYYINQFIKGKNGTGFLLEKIDHGTYKKVQL